MLRDLFFWISKTLLQMTVWVVILSTSWEGKTLFERINNIMLQNRVVNILVDELDYATQELFTVARKKLNEWTPPEHKG